MNAPPKFLVGTASWTDPTLTATDEFYPRSVRTPAERLSFYAERFPTVEVDSTYYALPSERNSRLWVERTPPGFLFNVKAFALLTRHPAEIARLPKTVRSMLSEAERAGERLTKPSPEVLELAFRMFAGALEPLRQDGKLGKLVFQFPPYFVRSQAAFDYIDSLPERLAGFELAIEFRHPSWVVEGAVRAQTLEFLARRGLAYVSVDAPRGPAIMPSFLETTGPDAYVRFHGRNGENWFRRGIAPAERYKYLYSERELSEWVAPLKRLRSATRAFVIFNNCYRNFGVMNATTMSQMLAH